MSMQRTYDHPGADYAVGQGAALMRAGVFQCEECVIPMAKNRDAKAAN